MKGHTMQKQTERAIWNIHQAAKDNVNNQVTIAVANGQLGIDRAALPNLLTLINASMESAYSQGIAALSKMLQVSDPLAPAPNGQKKGKKGSSGA